MQVNRYYEESHEPDEDFEAWRAETGGTWPQYLQAIADGLCDERVAA